MVTKTDPGCGSPQPALPIASRAFALIFLRDAKLRCDPIHYASGHLFANAVRKLAAAHQEGFYDLELFGRKTSRIVS